MCYGFVFYVGCSVTPIARTQVVWCGLQIGTVLFTQAGIKCLVLILRFFICLDFEVSPAFIPNIIIYFFQMLLDQNNSKIGEYIPPLRKESIPFDVFQVSTQYSELNLRIKHPLTQSDER